MQFHSLDQLARLVVIMACLALATAGCAVQKEPLVVQVTQLAPYEHAARPPDCQMPVLSTPPAANYEQVAIVEAWADIKDQTSDVMPALQRKACETGADALVIVDSARQDIRNLLYQATPNETRNDVDSKGGDNAAYINAAEHTKMIGEAGHSGYYIDAVAINYRTAQDKSGASDNPPAGVPPNS